MALFDITSMFFRMRTRVYKIAQAHTSSIRNVIAIFNAGRFQEWRKIRIKLFLYIAIDLDIDIDTLTKHSNKIKIIQFDISSILRLRETVLYCKIKSEDFVVQTNANVIIASMGVPAVFLFSISYHIGVITRFKSSHVSMFGYGYIHDYIPPASIDMRPITMRVEREPGSTAPLVVARFGKSKYAEPVLLMKSVPDMRLVSAVMPDVWSGVDSAAIDIMSRAVIMYSS
ncbi:hypothetical protein BELL_0164g00080 [Botrytis elliptica]|uniref:Uncharacterized protein n=1 Tax=Botrytis elliptica TaxID=278938 RepID=A0A4Z1JR60_9HELO|nr:hypothetical protein BELL_0164g00080 [Botrytis elliptica]